MILDSKVFRGNTIFQRFFSIKANQKVTKSLINLLTLLYYLEFGKEIPGYGVTIGLFTTWKFKIKLKIERKDT